MSRIFLPFGIDLKVARGIERPSIRLISELPCCNVVALFSEENRKANRGVVDALKNIAAGLIATPAQVALAWLLAQKPWIAPIPGTTKLHRLEENVRAGNLESTADNLREIESALSTIAVRGDRYPARRQASLIPVHQSRNLQRRALCRKTLQEKSSSLRARAAGLAKRRAAAWQQIAKSWCSMLAVSIA